MYDIEDYWSKVGKEIEERGEGNVIAGDDEPFYVYKRKKFLETQFSEVDFKNKVVAELGCGPGGNIQEVLKKGPEKIIGLDISPVMIGLSTKKFKENDKVALHVTNGRDLPLQDRSVDLIYSVTVLQHITDESMFLNAVKEMCRVSNDQVIIFERIEKFFKGTPLNHGRTVSQYQTLFESHGYQLEEYKSININISYYVCGAYRKLLNSKSRIEGEPLSAISIFAEQISLPITKLLDKIFPADRDQGMLVFKRK